jgi:5-methylthioadenosine/S-adenosylhomocysteine deaminase
VIRTLLHGAQVITMSLGRPDAEGIEIGEQIDRPETETVDLSGHIIIPGLIQSPPRCTPALLTSKR